MKKNKLIFLIILATIFSLITKCSPTEPPDNELKPGRRDYTWTVDTLEAPWDTYYRLWASSPNDVWATSPGDWDKSIAHYDGFRWSLYGINGIVVPTSVFGFAWNSIFITAVNGAVWKYDGSWNKFAQLTKDGRTDIIFNDLWGESANDLYVFGGYPDSIGAFNNSVIAHYFNNNWLILNTKGVNGLVAKLFKDFDKNLYIITYKPVGGFHPDSSMIYEYNNLDFEKIYSSIWTGGLQSDISLIDKEVYFILGNRIAKRINGQFQTFLQIDNPNFYQRIWGRNEKDIFLFMTDGLAHYNGTDLQYLFTITKNPTQIFGAVIFEKEVFFLVYESPTNLNLIYHGKLN